MMKLRLDMARHFWRDEQIATWESSDQFPAELLSWVKSHYAELVGAKTSWTDHQKGTVYFLYRDEREVHGRLATRLTACWTEDRVSNHDAVLKALRICQEGLHDGPLTATVDVVIESHKPGLSSRRWLWYTLASILAGMAIVALAFLTPNTLIKTSRPGPRLGQPQSVENNRDSTQNPSSLLSPQSTSNLDQEESQDKAIRPCDLIQRLRINQPESCFKYFLLEQCKFKENMKHYQDWLNELWKNSKDHAEKIPCKRKVDEDSDLREILDKIFNRNKNEINKFKSYL